MRPLDAIGRRDVEDRFNSLTRNNGWAPANMSISLLGSIYRRPCVDLEGLRNPVELWRAGGGKYHPPKRRKISAPAEVLPRWKKGIEAGAIAPVARDAFRFVEGLRHRWQEPTGWFRGTVVACSLGHGVVLLDGISTQSLAAPGGRRLLQLFNRARDIPGPGLGETYDRD